MSEDVAVWLLAVLVIPVFTLLLLLRQQKKIRVLMSARAKAGVFPPEQIKRDSLATDNPDGHTIGEAVYDRRLFRIIYDKAPVGMIVSDPDGEIFMANSILQSTLGYAEKDLVGKNIAELTHPDDMEGTIAALELIRTGEMNSYQLEKRYLHKSGHVVWVQVNAVMVRSRKDEPLYVIGQILDITGRKLASEQLRIWENIFRNTGWGMVLSYDGKTLSLLNPAFAAMHGYSVGELSGQPVSRVIAAYELERVNAFIRQAEETGHCTYESQDVRRDGSTFPVLVDITVVRDDDDRVLYRLSNIQDISESKAAADALRASELRLREAERMAHLGSWEWDMVTGEQTWSEETYRIFGLDPGTDEASYQNFVNLLDSEDRKVLADAAAAALAGQRPFRMEYKVHRPDGSIRCVISEAQLYGDEQGSVQTMIGTSLDVTESRKAERELRDSQARLQGLTANIPGVVFQAETEDNGRSFSFIYMNSHSGQLFGEASEHYLTDASLLTRHIFPADIETFESSRQNSAVNGIVWDWEGRIILTNREEKWINLRAMPRQQGTRLVWDGVMLNITNNKRAEQELFMSRQLLRDLAAEMEVLREEERKYIAREIHDELGQILTALRMDVSLLRLRFPDISAPFPDSVRNMTSLVDRAITAVRSVASDLRPAALDMGLQDALEWLRKEFSDRTGIICSLTMVPDDIELEESRAVAVFRIVQESLTNISRYANASRADIMLTAREGMLEIFIRDNGIGFDPAESAKKKKSYGLLGMRERAIALGGTLQINSNTGKGTEIALTIPLSENTLVDNYDSGINCR